MRVLKDNVLVKALPRQQVGDIIIPESAGTNQLRATVVVVGPGCRKHGEQIQPDVKVGDVVIVSSSIGLGGHSIVSIGGEDHMIISENYILAVE